MTTCDDCTNVPDTNGDPTERIEFCDKHSHKIETWEKMLKMLQDLNDGMSENDPEMWIRLEAIVVEAEGHR